MREVDVILRRAETRGQRTAALFRLVIALALLDDFGLTGLERERTTSTQPAAT